MVEANEKGKQNWVQVQLGKLLVLAGLLGFFSGADIQRTVVDPISEHQPTVTSTYQPVQPCEPSTSRLEKLTREISRTIRKFVDRRLSLDDALNEIIDAAKEIHPLSQGQIDAIKKVLIWLGDRIGNTGIDYLIEQAIEQIIQIIITPPPTSTPSPTPSLSR